MTIEGRSGSLEEEEEESSSNSSTIGARMKTPLKGGFKAFDEDGSVERHGIERGVSKEKT